MLSTVLRSPRATATSILIMRAFVRLRELIATNKELSERLAKLEQESSGHGQNIRTLFEPIHGITSPPERPQPRIGFKPEES